MNGKWWQSPNPYSLHRHTNGTVATVPSRAPVGPPSWKRGWREECCLSRGNRARVARESRGKACASSGRFPTAIGEGFRFHFNGSMQRNLGKRCHTEPHSHSTYSHKYTHTHTHKQWMEKVRKGERNSYRCVAVWRETRRFRFSATWARAASRRRVWEIKAWLQPHEAKFMRNWF